MLACMLTASSRGGGGALHAVLQDVITAIAWTSDGQLAAGYASGVTQLFCVSESPVAG
jgi:hypothetical protein